MDLTVASSYSRLGGRSRGETLAYLVSGVLNGISSAVLGRNFLYVLGFGGISHALTLNHLFHSADRKIITTMLGIHFILVGLVLALILVLKAVSLGAYIQPGPLGGRCNKNDTNLTRCPSVIFWIYSNLLAC